MRLGKTVFGLFLLLAGFMAPTMSFAHERQSPMAPKVVAESHVDVVVAAIDDSGSMDCRDCCPRHGSNGVPCSSSACCVGHCVGALSILYSEGLLQSDFATAIRPASSQVLTSSTTTPPFRPPRV